jgi:hypothetical protein
LNDNKLTFKATTLKDGNDVASDDLKTCNYASSGNSTNRGVNLRAFINAHRLISDANGFFFEVDNGNGNGFGSGQESVFNF